MTEPDESTLRRWLLHQLPASETQRLEQQLLQDDGIDARLFAAETDLLDDFARDRLNATDRIAVVQHLLVSPDQRERLRFAAALARHTATASAPAPAASPAAGGRDPDTQTPARRQPSRRRWALAWGGLAAACAVLVVVIGLRHGNQTMPAITPQSAMTIALADPERGARPIEIHVGAGIDTIHLQTEIGAGAPGARYTLTVSAGTQVLFRAANLVAADAGPYRYVHATIPARTLGRGERRIEVAAQGTTAEADLWHVYISPQTASKGDDR